MAVGRVDVSVHLLVLVVERVEAVELVAHGEDDAVREGGHREDAEDRDQRQKAELADAAPAPVRALRLGAMSAQQHGRGRILAPASL